MTEGFKLLINSLRRIRHRPGTLHLFNEIYKEKQIACEIGNGGKEMLFKQEKGSDGSNRTEPLNKSTI